MVHLVEASDAPEGVLRERDQGSNRADAILASHPWHLYPVIYSRWRYLWVLTVTVGPYRFASPLLLPQKARSAMRRGILDTGLRGLVLKNSDGTIVLPRSHAAL